MENSQGNRSSEWESIGGKVCSARHLAAYRSMHTQRTFAMFDTRLRLQQMNTRQFVHQRRRCISSVPSGNYMYHLPPIPYFSHKVYLRVSYVPLSKQWFISLNSINYIIFVMGNCCLLLEVRTTLLKINVFWDCVPCSLVAVYWRFRGAQRSKQLRNTGNCHQITRCNIPEDTFALRTWYIREKTFSNIKSQYKRESSGKFWTSGHRSKSHSFFWFLLMKEIFH